MGESVVGFGRGEGGVLEGVAGIGGGAGEGHGGGEGGVGFFFVDGYFCGAVGHGGGDLAHVYRGGARGEDWGGREKEVSGGVGGVHGLELGIWVLDIKGRE